MKTTYLRLHGMADLDRAIGELKLSTARGVLRRSAIKALEPIAETARELAPDDPETPPPNDLKSSIAVSTRQKSSRFSRAPDTGLGEVRAYVGPSAEGYSQAMIQEMGAKPHKITPKASRRGAAGRAARAAGKKAILGFDVGGDSVAVGEVDHPGHRPHPYMRPAWERHKGELLARVAQILGEEIQKTMQRAQRRAARLAQRKV